MRINYYKAENMTKAASRQTDTSPKSASKRKKSKPETPSNQKNTESISESKQEETQSKDTSVKKETIPSKMNCIQKIWVLCCLSRAAERLNLPHETTTLTTEFYKTFCDIFLACKDKHLRISPPTRQNSEKLLKSFIINGQIESPNLGGRPSIKIRDQIPKIFEQLEHKNGPPSIRAVAKHLGVSPSTVINICKELNYRPPGQQKTKQESISKSKPKKRQDQTNDQK